jgi:ATP-binding cassette, subfamily G (WHITE), member 1
VACGEHGDHSRKLVNAIENGKRDIRTEADFDKIKASNGKNGDAKVRKSLGDRGVMFDFPHV